MYDGNFIRLAATNGVKIENNIFKDAKESNNGAKEAIKLIVTDKTTGEWNYKWSKQDKTSNINLTIKGNTFANLERAIGTVKYTENLYHTNV